MCPGGPWPPGHSLPPGRSLSSIVMNTSCWRADSRPTSSRTTPSRSRTPAVWRSPGSVLVDVIAMLEVAVAVMDVVHMIAMGGRLTAVSFGVRAAWPACTASSGWRFSPCR